MARITKLQKITKERNTVHDAADAAYTIFTGLDGKRYLQIDTYGSERRKIKGETSQCLQFDESCALELKRIIEDEL